VEGAQRERYCFGCRRVGRRPFRSRQKIGRWTGVTRLRDCERPELEPKEVVDSSIAGMVAKSMRMQAIINN
jgi:hypothetical protein